MKTDQYLFAAGSQLVRSSDFGESWEIITSTASSALSNHLRYHPKNPDIQWFGGSSSYSEPILMLSEDHGVTWETINFDTLIPPDNAVTGIAFDVDDHNIVFVCLWDKIIKSVDRGRSWIIPFYTFNGPGGTLIEDHSRRGRLFLGLGWTVLESNNMGDTWTDLEYPVIGTITPPNSLITSMVYSEVDQTLYIGSMSTDTSVSNVFIYR